MAKVTINEEMCKSCGLCVLACPRKIVALSETKLNKKGVNPAEVIDAHSCTGCAMCAVMCPDVIIKVER